jgi:hypothetical protein
MPGREVRKESLASRSTRERQQGRYTTEEKMTASTEGLWTHGGSQLYTNHSRTKVRHLAACAYPFLFNRKSAAFDLVWVTI